MSNGSSSKLLRSTSVKSCASEDFHEGQALLTRADHNRRYDGSNEDDEDYQEGENDDLLSSAGNLISAQTVADKPKEYRFRWPTLIGIFLAISFVCLIFLSIVVTPALLEEYAKKAVSVEPTKISIDSFTVKGFKARIQADFKVDASRVLNRHVRLIGRFLTWNAREVEIKQSTVEVTLPDYNNTLVGIATIPGLAVEIRNGHMTSLDFNIDLELENIDGIRLVANDWLDGGFDRIHVVAKANFALQSGLLSLGSQSISKDIIFEDRCWMKRLKNETIRKELPTIPRSHVDTINFREDTTPTYGNHTLVADVSIFIENSQPVELEVPALDFQVLVHGCDAANLIEIASAVTSSTRFHPYSGAHLDVSGTVRDLPKSLVEPCPDSDSSPLDVLISDHIHGKNTTVFIRGSESPNHGLPDWISKILSEITVPIIIPGHQYDGSTKNFSLTNTEFSLPDFFAEPGSDRSYPRLSGKIIASVKIPQEINLNISVSELRAFINVLFKGMKFGEVNLDKWQKVECKIIEEQKDAGRFLKLQTLLRNAPVKITDDSVFAKFVESLLMEKEAIMIGIEALVDAQVSSVLGKILVKDIPAEGTVPINS
ncbi:putative pre-rrna processing protein [Golovinomyces cichoracearum]|uniref:Putative pre-rrna processing protein n=1 Tax=Golovinomyces cichoracearum TaxID=62708 RepID=A0A420HIH6_9PEZI|nr:putative pre-rrna processing protein [Golovinomyces cichoracearum]